MTEFSFTAELAIALPVVSEPIPLPYRLETKEDVRKARACKLLNLGEDYGLIKAVANRLTISRPDAFIKAHVVKKDFYKINEHNLSKEIVHCVAAGFDPIGSYHLIESTIPWLGDLVQCDKVSTLFRSFPSKVQKLCAVSNTEQSPTEQLATLLAGRKLIRNEALVLANTRKTKHITKEDLKRLIAGMVLLDPGNNDILQALRTARQNHKDTVTLYQQACAELLFVRIPSFITTLTPLDPKMFRLKFLNRIVKIGVTPHEKLALFGYLPPDVSMNTIFPAMEKARDIAKKILREDKATLIDEYIIGMKHQAKLIKTLHEGLFMSQDLNRMRQCYLSSRIMQKHTCNKGCGTRTSNRLISLTFYPTKDYMDMCKARFSGDCTGFTLSEHQLATPEFFNIRVFKGTKWLGNIYMLDFIKQHGILLVDRIQMPRDVDASYLNFFGHLKEIFQEMFSSIQYETILLPLTLSNHSIIQKAWNQYRKMLSKSVACLPVQHKEYFESLKSKSHYKLV